MELHNELFNEKLFFSAIEEKENSFLGHTRSIKDDKFGELRMISINIAALCCLRYDGNLLIENLVDRCSPSYSGDTTV